MPVAVLVGTAEGQRRRVLRTPQGDVTVEDLLALLRGRAKHLLARWPAVALCVRLSVHDVVSELEREALACRPG